MRTAFELVALLAGIAAPVLLLLMLFDIVAQTNQNILLMISFLMVSNSGKAGKWEIR